MQLTRTTRARRHTSLSYLAKSSDTQNDTTLKAKGNECNGNMRFTPQLYVAGNAVVSGWFKLFSGGFGVAGRLTRKTYLTRKNQAATRDDGNPFTEKRLK
jgi:hypothetical protein